MVRKEKEEEKRKEGFEGLSYNLSPATKGPTWPLYSVKDADRLGEFREPRVFETEHHVYTVPFRYRNVEVENWLEYGGKGIEMAADIGSITIVEKSPIIAVTVVGSGCSGSNYNIVEWWGPGEKLSRLSKMPKSARQLIKRQRIDNLNGQHNALIQQALTQEPPEFKSVEDATEYLKMIQTIVYQMTYGYYRPGSLMSGLYENTAYFRIGDTSRPEHTAYKVVIRGGGVDKEEAYKGPGKYLGGSQNQEPGVTESRYPADYAFRLIDLLVEKSQH